jgi:hypothetical protein
LVASQQHAPVSRDDGESSNTEGGTSSSTLSSSSTAAQHQPGLAAASAIAATSANGFGYKNSNSKMLGSNHGAHVIRAPVAASEATTHAKAADDIPPLPTTPPPPNVAATSSIPTAGTAMKLSPPRGVGAQSKVTTRSKPTAATALSGAAGGGTPSRLAGGTPINSSASKQIPGDSKPVQGGVGQQHKDGDVRRKPVVVNGSLGNGVPSTASLSQGTAAGGRAANQKGGGGGVVVGSKQHPRDAGAGGSEGAADGLFSR